MVRISRRDLLRAATAIVAGRAGAGESTSLFNGRDLAGWQHGGRGPWTVEDGAIAGQSDHDNPGPGYLMTEGEYRDFRLALESWISRRGNSGICIREPNQTWGHLGDQRPAHGERRGYEIQIDYIDRKNPTGSVYGARASSKPAGAEECWNHCEIECRGTKVAVNVGGELVHEYDGLRVQKGYIGMQSHGHVCRCRKINLAVLQPVRLVPVPSLAPRRSSAVSIPGAHLPRLYSTPAVEVATPPPGAFLGSIVRMRDRTVYSLVEAAAKTWGTNPALHQPMGEKGRDKYRVYSWIEYRQAVEEIAVGLNRIGVRKGDVVALNADTRAEFYLADIGIMTAGGVAAAVYTSYPAGNLVGTIRDCDARVVFAENPETMRALQEAAGSHPLDVRWILLIGEAEGAITLDQLREKGATAITDDAELLPQICADISPGDPAILYLTSGATGAPKMGLASHGSIVANVNMGPKVIDLGPGDATIAFLPSAHITQRIAMQMIPLRMGVPVWFSAGLSKLPNELKAIAPTFFVAPPRVWERIYASICTEIRKRGGVSRKLFYWALGLGLEAVRRKQTGRPIPGWLAQSLKIADKLVFSKIKARFGGRLRLAVSGAAPLGKDLADFYATIGMPIHEGYGLTEGGIVCLNPLGDPLSGSIGKALPGVDLMLAGDGELLIRAETLFSGYYKDEAATAEVLRDGWLYTGDIARIDDAGFVYITGRKKEVLVASNGKKIYPSGIENLFKMEPLINQVLLLGDKMPYAAALFTINPAAVESLPGMEGASKKPIEELVETGAVRKEIKQIVARVNAKLADFEKIRRYEILGRDFTIADGELTPTMKLRRTQVIKNHDAIIQTLYRGQPGNIES